MLEILCFFFFFSSFFPAWGPLNHDLFTFRNLVETESNLPVENVLRNEQEVPNPRSSAPTYFTERKLPLTLEEILCILKRPDAEKITYVPPINPRPGDVYVYSSNGEERVKNHWQCDQQNWKNNGNKTLPKKNPEVRKSYFISKCYENGN